MQEDKGFWAGVAVMLFFTALVTVGPLGMIKGIGMILFSIPIILLMFYAWIILLSPIALLLRWVGYNPD